MAEEKSQPTQIVPSSAQILSAELNNYSTQQLKTNNDQENAKELLNSFLESDLSGKSFIGPPKDFATSALRKEQYIESIKNDEEFLEIILKKYGSLENYLLINRETFEERIYDPLTDHEIEVEIITKKEFLTSNFISSQEMFLEMLGGICTIQYYKINGHIAQVSTTLKKSLIPSSEEGTRLASMASFGGSRFLVWDLIKQDWTSFYIKNVLRFVRDDTSGIE